jgi:hypothetical protein
VLLLRPATLFCQPNLATSTDAWSSSHNAGAHVLNVNAIANGTSVCLDLTYTGAESHTSDVIADKVRGVCGWVCLGGCAFRAGELPCALGSPQQPGHDVVSAPARVGGFSGHALGDSALSSHVCSCCPQVEGVLADYNAKDKVVAFVSDWGSNMLKAGDALQNQLENCVASVGCVQHLLNNALKDFAKDPALADVITKSKEVVVYINSHTTSRALYDQHKAALRGTALIKAGGTRFGTNVVSMQSVLANE